ncbi:MULTISPECIES: RNA methyltransferase [Roseivirga]|uniref:RNA methyltransferase n=1 Tax=Roseivirga spongicola TaxID=333140 RepID=A0A150XIK4_9BACT|nr:MULTISPECIES: RNA methyltransferase [Roseivirga]KYG78513.1 RNA methyltransferase [Roseivirga spongicola]MBO6661479.1 RNA methyltransferase [Roseivirga sp.]MBO6759409.1 RNA methyltransferase [Roseivirga sp.]MBO6908537.1 RNA methyltransferase [Roseivirga sp.]WPZ11437.1 RNA methyltransferase [Roseivirga spongicola]|tara:strand:- start:38 stop:580 length:543 start_codon:yes stop_codon:yes gene_type:complete
MRKISNEELNRPDLETFKEQEKNPIILVLDNLRSMHNVGSAFRTADAFAVEAVYLCGITAQPPHREIHKTALGATDSVEWKYFESTAKACSALKEAGYKIAAVEQADKSTSLETFQPKADEKLALVFGNEVFGVEENVVQSADLCLEIPQFGTKHSINVSVSMGVVLWDILSKLKFDSKA